MKSLITFILSLFIIFGLCLSTSSVHAESNSPEARCAEGQEVDESTCVNNCGCNWEDTGCNCYHVGGGDSEDSDSYHGGIPGTDSSASPDSSPTGSRGYSNGTDPDEDENNTNFEEKLEFHEKEGNECENACTKKYNYCLEGTYHGVSGVKGSLQDAVKGVNEYIRANSGNISNKTTAGLEDIMDDINAHLSEMSAIHGLCDARKENCLAACDQTIIQ